MASRGGTRDGRLGIRLGSAARFAPGRATRRFDATNARSRGEDFFASVVAIKIRLVLATVHALKQRTSSFAGSFPNFPRGAPRRSRRAAMVFLFAEVAGPSTPPYLVPVRSRRVGISRPGDANERTLPRAKWFVCASKHPPSFRNIQKIVVFVLSNSSRGALHRLLGALLPPALSLLGFLGRGLTHTGCGVAVPFD